MTGEIAIVGAGLTGLTLAGRLVRAGRRVTVFDKSRGLGGRLATRRSEAGSFDHGAPLVHCGADDIAPLVAAGSAVAVGGGYLGLPGMSGLVRPLAEGLDIRGGIEMTAVRDGTGGLGLVAGEATFGPYAQVVSTIPAPQAMRFARGIPEAEARLGAVAMAPVWTLLAAFGARPDLPERVTDGPVFDLVFRNASRPGRTGETWVAHARSDWTRARLETDREAILPELLAALGDLAGGALPPVTHAAAHRWRYGRTEVPLGAPVLSGLGGRLLFGGDWTLGGEARHALASASALGDAILG